MPKTRSFNPRGQFRSILCPVDFSTHSAVALKYAAILAKRSAGRLHVLHVNDPLLATAAAVAFADQDYAKVALDELRLFVARALPAGTKGIVIRCSVDTGDATRMIAAAAKRLRCDLIVMGTHGLSGVEKVLLGSTTERMLRRSSLPVLAVPPTPSIAANGQTPGRRWPGTAIMVPVDLRRESTRDIKDAEEIARAFGTGLVLIHVVPPIEAPPWFRADLSAHGRMQTTSARHQLEALERTVGPGISTEIQVATGRPADEIAAAAAEGRIGLVVMHRRKGPGWFGSRAGSIASGVLRHAFTPILLMPDRAVDRRQLTRDRLRATA